MKLASVLSATFLLAIVLTSIGAEPPAADATKALAGPDGPAESRSQPSNPAPRKGTTKPSRARVPYEAEAFDRGVTLRDGLFRRCMDANVAYLLAIGNVDDLLRPYRVAAGQPNPPGGTVGWDNQYPAGAAQFLMGACNTLRWGDYPELRRRVEQVLEGLRSCRAADGHLAVPGVPADLPIKKQWGYSWQMFTHGLLAAHRLGDPTALPMLRATHDWYLGRCADKPDRYALQDELNYQGHVASTLMFLSEPGKPEDLANAERMFVDRKWMKALAARDPKAIWRSPPAPKWPHCYLISAFEAYLDHYLATGDRAFLDAVQGGWELMRENWIHIGGSIAICEHGEYPPKSYPITAARHTGELCGSVFWIRLNHRLHQLFPDDERYVAEIERSIYNVGLAGQVPAVNGVYYHLLLEGTKKQSGLPWVKDPVPTVIHTCCEGMGTWLYGSLPQYVYSHRADGLAVNIFEASRVRTSLGGQSVNLQMDTGFPFEPEVGIAVAGPQRAQGAIRVRIPGWASKPMRIAVNGRVIATGQPGAYVALERAWSDGDRITFRLPAAVRLVKYDGENRIEGHNRYALLVGPVLLACLGSADAVAVPHEPRQVSNWLHPVPGKPLQYRVAELPDHLFVPYFQVDRETPYTCCPIVEAREDKHQSEAR